METVLLLLRATTSKQLPSGYQLYLSSAKPSYYTFPFSFLFINFDKFPQSSRWEFFPQDIQQWNICCDIDDIASFHKTVAFNTHIWHWKISQTGKLWVFGEPFIAKMRNSKNLKWWFNITLTSKVKWLFHYLWSIFHLAVQSNTLVSKLPPKFHQAICVHYVALKIDDKLCNKLYALKFNNHKSRGTKVVWKNEWFEIKFLLAKML